MPPLAARTYCCCYMNGLVMQLLLCRHAPAPELDGSLSLEEKIRRSILWFTQG